MKLNAEFQKYSFFRVPEWRWERVIKMADRRTTPGRCTKRDDDFIKKARHFWLHWRDCDEPEDREELFWATPGLYYAYELFSKKDTRPEGAFFLESRLLSNQPYEQIAKLMSTLPDTIYWYEALFFNVTEHLESRDWITAQVLMPALVKQVNTTRDSPWDDEVMVKPFMDGTLKLFCYFGGPIVADFFIGGMQSGRRLASADDLGSWLDQQWFSTVRRRSAQAAFKFDVNRFNVTELFAIHAKIIEIERSEESKDQQKTQAERHIKACLDEIPWAMGDDAKKLQQGTLLGRFDEMAAELRDDEVLRIGAGETVPDLKKTWPTALPPPRKNPVKPGESHEQVL